MSLSVVGGTLTAVGGTISGLTGGGPPTIAQLQVGTSTNGSSTTAPTVTLGSAPAVGSTMILIQGARLPDADWNHPAGWDILTGWDDAGASTCAWHMYGKVSTGAEQTSPTITFDNTSTNLRCHYAEWSGLEDLATIYDGASSVQHFESTSVASAWNPAAATADQDRAVYIPVLRVASPAASIDSDWAGVDGSNNNTNLMVARKIVTNGASLDTAIDWTTDRPFDAQVVVLRGAS